MPMNDNVDEELFSYDLFNDVLAGMSRMLLLLESDRIEEIADEEKLICDKVKLIFSTKDDLKMILINRNLLNFVISIRRLITKLLIR